MGDQSNGQVASILVGRTQFATIPDIAMGAPHLDMLRDLVYCASHSWSDVLPLLERTFNAHVLHTDTTFPPTQTTHPTVSNLFQGRGSIESSEKLQAPSGLGTRLGSTNPTTDTGAS